MSPALSSSVIAYLITSLCALVLARRGTNWRIRFLACVIALMPLCQAVALLTNSDLVESVMISRAAESVESILSLLCLAAIHVLNKENKDRKTVDGRLRLAESDSSGRADWMGILARTIGLRAS